VWSPFKVFVIKLNQATLRVRGLFLTWLSATAVASAFLVATPIFAVVQEQVYFESAVSIAQAPTRLTGFLYRPEEKGLFAAVVLMHGCGGLWQDRGEDAILGRVSA
jgi:poly(3-hydroxybutyrate) depolymerase